MRLESYYVKASYILDVSRTHLIPVKIKSFGIKNTFIYITRHLPGGKFDNILMRSSAVSYYTPIVR